MDDPNTPYRMPRNEAENGRSCIVDSRVAVGWRAKQGLFWG